MSPEEPGNLILASEDATLFMRKAPNSDELTEAPEKIHNGEMLCVHPTKTMTYNGKVVRVIQVSKVEPPMYRTPRFALVKE